MDFETMEERLSNWGRVVRSPRFQQGECAAWAKLYVALRNAERYPEEPPLSKDERDGWLIERAWAMIPDNRHKWLLKYSHVWRMSPEQVQTRMYKTHKLSIRGRKIEILMVEAERALLQKVSILKTREVLKTASFASCKPGLGVVSSDQMTDCRLVRDLRLLAWEAEASVNQTRSSSR